MPHKKIYKYITILAITSYNLLFSTTPPFLTENTTKAKIQEILMHHVKYKKINHDLIKRSYLIFLEELDPQKLYFTQKELKKYLNPSEKFLAQSIKYYNNANFIAYEELFQHMTQAIKRRRILEATDPFHTPLANGYTPELKEFCKDENDLLLRLKYVKSLQQNSIEKLNSKEKANILQQIAKKRALRENVMLEKEGIDKKRLIYSYVIKSIASSLDSHTNYFTPDEASDFLIQVQQRLFGIGAQFKDVINGFEITNILEDGPAKKNGALKVGDRIIAVDQITVIGMDITEVAKKIRGSKGSVVHIKALREGVKEPINTNIKREEIVLKESRYETSTTPFSDGVLAHIRLHSFYQDPNSSSSTDIRRALARIKKEHNIYGVILDLRENGGGALSQAVAVSSLFIKKGIVVSIQDHTSKVEHLRNLNDITSFDGPLVVLTDKASASAAEIVALCLQDWGRAIVVGDTTTFGKGTYQIFTLSSHNQEKINPQGEYKVTRGMYYTVGGKTPQCTGVKADVVIPGILSALKIGEKYTSYPIQNESIEPNFQDDLKDIHPLYRNKVKKIYQVNQQKQNTEYTQLLPLLMKRSNTRITSNKKYQEFLSSLSENEYALFKKQDMQLHEAYNVLKDLIIFSKKENSTLTQKEHTPQ